MTNPPNIFALLALFLKWNKWMHSNKDYLRCSVCLY